MSINLMNVLKAALFTPLREEPTGDVPWGLVMLLWGPPGVGKSVMIKDLCRKWGLYPKTLSPGTDGEGAFGVTPVPDKHGKVMCYPPPYWAADVAGGGVVFLDEVNQAPPTLQPAIMGIALDRRIGDHTLGPKVRRIAAANPPNIAAGGWPLAAPVANRFGHLEWEAPDADSWSDWLLGANVADNETFSAEEEEKRVLAHWNTPWAMAAGVVQSFIRARGSELLFRLPKPGSENLSRAWPSHRTWEMATRAFASATVHNLTDAEREIFVGSFIGNDACSELMGFLDKMDLPNPEDVLDGKIKFEHDPHRLDRTAAVLSSCAALVSPPNAPKRRQRAAQLWTILSDKKLLEDAMDVGFIAGKRLVVGRLHAMKEAYPVLKKMLPILEAAGVRFDPSKARSAQSGFEQDEEY